MTKTKNTDEKTGILIDNIGSTIAVEQLQEALHKAVESFNEEFEHYLRDVIQATDWDECEVVDVFSVGTPPNHRPDEPLETFSAAFRRERYESRHAIPDYDDYQDVYDGRVGTFIRFSEQKCRTAGIDPETGVDTDD
jgi:hypothetical protein